MTNATGRAGLVTTVRRPGGGRPRGPASAPTPATARPAPRLDAPGRGCAGPGRRGTERCRPTPARTPRRDRPSPSPGLVGQPRHLRLQEPEAQAGAEEQDVKE